MTALPDDVRRWIDQQDESDQNALVRTWDLAGLAADATPPDTDQAWSRLDALLDDAPDASAMAAGLRAWQTRERPDALRTPSAPVPPSLLMRRAALWTGVMATALVLVTVLWVQPRTFTATDGALAVALPDGSEVTLAPGSALQHRRGLRGATRRVELAGQAYFEVERDGRPFEVETFNAHVEVLGTAFDVHAWPGTETAVTLVEGSVRLRSDRGAVVLQPGQVSRVTDGAPTAPAAIQTDAVVAWRGGAFSVVDAPLASVAAALEARFGRRVRLDPSIDPTQRLTLFLPSADSADVVLRDLAAYLDLRIQVVADRYDVLPR